MEPGSDVSSQGRDEGEGRKGEDRMEEGGMRSGTGRVYKRVKGRWNNKGDRSGGEEWGRQERRGKRRRG